MRKQLQTQSGQLIKSRIYNSSQTVQPRLASPNGRLPKHAGHYYRHSPRGTFQDTNLRISNESLTELQKAARINYFLGKVHDLLARDEDISKQVKYYIKERGENDRNRFAKILDFQEVDQDTLTVLGQNYDNWKEDPESFWIRPKAYRLGLIAPQAQVVGCYIQTRRDDA